MVQIEGERLFINRSSGKIMQNSFGTYKENGPLNECQIVKYIMKLLSFLYQGSDKWT